MTHRELVTQMRDVLIQHHTDPDYQTQRWEAIAAARNYLAAPEQSEPVAWMHRSNYMHFIKEKPLEEIGFLFVPLYTHPAPKAEPVNTALLKALQDALEWIDAVPADVVLPAMPGFDRDYVDALVATAERAPQPKAEPVNQTLLEALTHAVEIAEAKRPGTWDDLLPYRATIAQAAQAAQPAELTEAEISLIACAHLEPEADDMHQLVRFARAVLAAHGAKK